MLFRSQTDDVADTVSYADVYEAVKAEMEVPSKLLEPVSYTHLPGLHAFLNEQSWR